jgi:hypothetical protein
MILEAGWRIEDVKLCFAEIPMDDFPLITPIWRSVITAILVISAGPVSLHPKWLIDPSDYFRRRPRVHDALWCSRGTPLSVL